jgi:hypothetical protein
MKDRSPFKVMSHMIAGVTWYSVTIDPGTLSSLVKAMSGVGLDVNGRTTEAILLKLSEIGEPVWANELFFDSEAEVCTVKSTRKSPLMSLMRRFQRRLAEPARMRQLVKSVPEVWHPE